MSYQLVLNNWILDKLRNCNYALIIYPSIVGYPFINLVDKVLERLFQPERLYVSFDVYVKFTCTALMFALYVDITHMYSYCVCIVHVYASVLYFVGMGKLKMDIIH